MIRLSLIGLLLLGLNSCALFSPPRHSLDEWPLLPPASLQQSWQKLQRVNLYQPDQTEASLTVLVAWSVNHNQISVAALTPTGQSLFRLRYDGATLQETYSDMLPAKVRKTLSARALLAQLQLAHWPAEQVTRNLQDTPWHWHSSGTPKRLRLGAQTILTMQSLPDQGTGENVQIIHYPSAMRLHVETLNPTPMTIDQATGAKTP